MKRIVSAVAASIVAAAALLAPAAAQTNGLSATGLLPVYDSSGETHGELFAWHTTPAIYDVMKQGGRELVLLNPGGAYSPIDEAGALEFARLAGVRNVVMPRMVPTRRENPKDKSPELQIEVKVIDVQNGAMLHQFSLSEEVKRRDLEAGFDFGSFFSASRKIEKQPLGKIIRKFAEGVRTNLLSVNGGALVYPSAALHPGPHPPSCDVEFNVRYVRQRSTSKAYSVVVNNREESVGVDNDGTAHLTLRAGLNLFEVSVKDPPYRLPVQKEYDINRWIDCTPEERRLTMEIGAAGEALIVARP